MDMKSLSFSDIRNVKDVAELETILDRLEIEVEHIKAQLEFPAEYETDDWEVRAINALANKRALRNRAWSLLDKMKTPKEDRPGPPVADYAAKERYLSAREEVAKKNAEMALEVQRLSVEKARVKYEHLSRTDTYFRQLVTKYLTMEQIRECSMAAEAQAMAYMAAHKQEEVA